MGSQLHQALRNLCFNTQWKYAVFWKLKHRSRMMLTLEDAYYDNHNPHDPSENKWFSEMVNNLRDGHYSYDPIGLAVAKMSYHVYSLGKGIVGEVAVTGKHMWISADEHLADSFSSFEYNDGWQTQFSAGIRTIAVVAVIPHGVVQLGSLNMIAEDLKLVNHIRNIFFELQDSTGGHIPTVIPCSMENSSCLSDISTRSSGSGMFRDCISNLDGTMNKDKTNIWSPMFPSLGKPGGRSFVVPLPDGYPKKTIEMNNKSGGPEYSMSGFGQSAELNQSTSEICRMERQKQVQTKSVVDMKCDGETSGFRDLGVGSEDNDTPSSRDFFSNKINLCNAIFPADNSREDVTFFPSILLDSAPSDNQNGVLWVPEPSDIRIQEDSKKNLEFQTEFNHMDTLNTALSFSAGCELYEALGPAFRKQNTYCDLEAEKTEMETVTEMPIEVMGSSNLLTENSGSEHLLEAVVANVCHSGSNVKSPKSFCKSVVSLLTTEKMVAAPSSDMHTTGSASFDQSSHVEEDTLHCLNSSGTSGVRFSKGFSSTSPGRCSEQLERPQESAKINKKRTRTGENCRPRPRDRQLIQDRIKELRELVPNGSKCSIDSLLERTIKHMLFMQCITKHADKLDKCVESKLLDKETSSRGSSNYEQGSSWAMEVGNHLKVCPIRVENINMNGQILVEMLCEDCSHFLEMAEAIRSLDLIILKGVTEAFGEKTWLRFVVEGQNRNMHRMDILWSLVQILQSKTKV